MKKTVALFLCAGILCLSLSGCSLLSLLSLMLSSRSEVAVRPVETAIATRAPETVATEAIVAREPVELLTKYEKAYVPYTYPGGLVGESSVDHFIRIPLFTSDSADASRINREIQSRCQEAISTLEAGKEQEVIFCYNYQTLQQGSIVGLLMDYTVGFQSSEFAGSYQFYYFDHAQGKELTYEEYLQALGLTPETALEKVRAAGIVDTEMFPDWTLEALITSKHGTVLVIHSDMSLNGTVLIESNYPILD